MAAVRPLPQQRRTGVSVCACNVSAVCQRGPRLRAPFYICVMSNRAKIVFLNRFNIKIKTPKKLFGRGVKLIFFKIKLLLNYGIDDKLSTVKHTTTCADTAAGTHTHKRALMNVFANNGSMTAPVNQGIEATNVQGWRTNCLRNLLNVLTHTMHRL